MFLFLSVLGNGEEIYLSIDRKGGTDLTSEEFRNNPMFLRNQFQGDGVFGMPCLKKDDVDLKQIELIGYDKLSENQTSKIVHFFLDDYKFEVLWKNPEPRIERLKQYKAVLLPNYSMYTEMPMALQLYNTFRSRWCGVYFQSKGIKVIPTVAWGHPDTFWFCFDGIEKESIVAVSTLGVRTEKALFMQGYSEMFRKLSPSAVICYGKPFDEMSGNIIEIDYEETNHYNKSNDVFSIEQKQQPYIKTFYGFITTEKGMGSAGGGSSPQNAGNTASTGLSIPKQRVEDLPQNVKQAYEGYSKSGWKGNFHGQARGTRAGGNWDNDDLSLPVTDYENNRISYREYDINDKIPGYDRDKQRFVVGSDGRVYYTLDHYHTFTEVID